MDDYGALVTRIDERLAALGRLVKTYANTDEADTSPDERRKLAEVDDLLDQAMDRFS